jgi:CheY-like chemotaxis protein
MNQLNVLVCDDEAKIRDLIRGYLEADGFALIEAATGPDACYLCSTNSPFSSCSTSCCPE